MAQPNPSFLRDHLTELYQLVAVLKEKINELQLDNEQLKQTISNLKDKVQLITVNHIETHKTLANQAIENSELKHENNYLQELIDRLSHKISLLHSNLSDSKSTLAHANEHAFNLQAEVDLLKQQNSLPQTIVFIINTLYSKINVLERELQRATAQTVSATRSSAQLLRSKKETIETAQLSPKKEDDSSYKP